MRPFMKMPNELGYTFLESIFQLLIMTVFIHLFLLFFFWKGPIEQRYADHSSTEWELFSADLQYLLSDVSEIRLLNSGKTIRLRNGRGLIDIELSGTVIRKRTDENGHIPLVTGVKAVAHTFDGMTITAHVTMLDNSVKVRGFAVGLYPK
ncbi:ComGF family competence protein [Sporosarcina sp. E16_3]|uniref:ComGF family competence protein n=1 Tax=Sporosarcina sp. E16_3 TaxID=2789293 RepID=UPI001A9107EF|nr:ComGF family competence protein [Sporosarcina sp. E16_3]MBO0600334.1 ComGF family competence protein [Sporosarcina sp. E16_3]